MTDHDLLNDPYLALPLDGVRLIEASAGTGKTFTLATLFTRLVVEKGWRIGQILAVTFTDAATQELRKRIRERLALAAQLVERAPGEQDSPEVALTRVILQRQLALGEETPAALARRLQTAADEIDHRASPRSSPSTASAPAYCANMRWRAGIPSIRRPCCQANASCTKNWPPTCGACMPTTRPRSMR